MSYQIQFTKYSGTGNDFILIDNRSRLFNGTEKELFRSLCERKTGIGADGILLINAPTTLHCSFMMVYFNSDGRPAEMCGNGARSCAYHAATNNIASDDMQFEVGTDIYHANVDNARVYLQMQEPRDLKIKPGVLNSLQSKTMTEFEEGGFVNTGVPHYVVFVQDIDHIDIDTLGRELRYDKAFTPQGANINFAEPINEHHLKIRTYERGVEGETLACGTGAVATALIADMTKKVKFPVKLTTQGGELHVSIDAASQRPLLAGEVQLVFTGKITVK